MELQVWCLSQKTTEFYKIIFTSILYTRVILELQVWLPRPKDRVIWNNFLWKIPFINLPIDRSLMGTDIKTVRSMGFDYWATHVGGEKIKTDELKQHTRTDVMTYLKFAYRTLCTNPEAIIWPTIISVTYLRVASMDKVIVCKSCDEQPCLPSPSKL